MKNNEEDIILKSELEKVLHDKDFEKYSRIVKNLTFQQKMEILNIKKNRNLILKNLDLDFLEKVFKSLDTDTDKKEILQINVPVIAHSKFFKIQKNINSVNSFLDKDNKKNKIKELMILLFKKGLEFSEPEKFHFSRYDRKIYNKIRPKEIEKINKILNSFDIDENEQINIFKFAGFSLENIETIFSFEIFQKKETQKNLIKNCLENSNSIKELDKVFNKYEKEIYEIYNAMIDNREIWRRLSDDIYRNYTITNVRTYYDEEIVNWFDKKNIGYKKNPIPYEILTIDKETRRNYESTPKEKIEKLLDENLKFKVLSFLKDIDNKKNDENDLTKNLEMFFKKNTNINQLFGEKENNYHDLYLKLYYQKRFEKIEKKIIIKKENNNKL